jgi:hypothetical protein
LNAEVPSEPRGSFPRGFVIENKLDRDDEGFVHSRYWLRYDPERDNADGK